METNRLLLEDIFRHTSQLEYNVLRAVNDAKNMEGELISHVLTSTQRFCVQMFRLLRSSPMQLPTLLKPSIVSQ